LLLGLKYWNRLGSKLRVEAGDSSTIIKHRADYTFNLSASGADPFYNINLSDQNIVSTDKTVPGLFAYHNNKPFSTKDKDNDVSTSDCSRNYGNTAWWHVSCWDGSFWGLNSTSKPYWTSSSSDYYDWGAFWIR
jgi:hypothetical protein